MKWKELKTEHKLKFISLISSTSLVAVFVLPNHDDPIGYAGQLFLLCCLVAVPIYLFSMGIFHFYKQRKQKNKSQLTLPRLNPNATHAEAVHAATLQHLREQEMRHAAALQKEARMKVGCFLLVAIPIAIYFFTYEKSDDWKCYDSCLERKRSQNYGGSPTKAQIDWCHEDCFVFDTPTND